MRFVEAIVGELVEQVPDLCGLVRIDTIFRGAFQELGTLCIHRLLNFFAHGTAQQVGPPKAIARHFLRDLHHLLLIDDDALGLVQNVINGWMQHFALAQPVLNLAIFRDVFHRTGPIKRDQRHNVFDAGGFHALKRVHHTRAFHLEHSHSLGSRIELVGCFIVQRDATDVILHPGGRHIKFGAVRRHMQWPACCANLVDSILNYGERF